jgi:hypothetical protein
MEAIDGGCRRGGGVGAVVVSRCAGDDQPGIGFRGDRQFAGELAYPGSLAVDGDATTRWSSAFSGPQTLEHIGANDPLRTGTDSAPVTFTPETTHP